MSYRPLPDSLTIKDSSIHGLGIFATCDIPEKTVLGIAHVKMVEWLNFPQDYCRTPLGGFYNHSDTPNCETSKEGRYLYIITITDIKEGEEITATYTLYDPS